MADDSNAQEEQPVLALVFELENIAITGRDGLFKAFEKALSKQKVKFTPSQYSRHCVDKSIHSGVEGVMNAEKGSETVDEALVDEVIKNAESALTAAAKSPNADLDAAITRLGKKGIVFGAVSALPEALSESLSTALNAEERGITVGTTGNPRGRRLSSDSWRKLASKLDVRPFHCVALCTSAAGCRAAVAANMICVAIPDAYTEFQDFGGVKAVLDSFDAKVIQRLFDAMND